MVEICFHLERRQGAFPYEIEHVLPELAGRIVDITAPFQMADPGHAEFNQGAKRLFHLLFLKQTLLHSTAHNVPHPIR